MILKDIFKKPVDRPIEGVIKADDETTLRLELEEYVLTAEVEKRLELFLDAYNAYEGANGVWISGFFGSGKSHLLKILAITMENRQVDGTKALELILPKCNDNEILKAEFKRAATTPSQSILFNIDQKADIISKGEVDALLSVFVKVFNEASGYYAKHPYIAQFERDLDNDGLFDAFKRHFQDIAKKEWVWGRSRAGRVGAHVDQAYSKTTGAPVTNILSTYRQDYSLSIEEFALQVKAYIDKQVPGFRLNFFVDEVGQYIADSIKLMTNLQTIAESLATKCQGQAWVIVTAQEDMTHVVGEMASNQKNDFTKIMARFACRMKLTSANVDEVIQKRLLEKNEPGIEFLSEVYHKEENNLKTLFSFGDGSQTLPQFRDKEDFLNCYPFIPYQFSLFQDAIQNLSRHNAFEGKHSSVGERSMLGVFRDACLGILGKDSGILATFDQLYDGLRTALLTDIQRAILQAEQRLSQAPMAIKLLKALLLVKYIKAFKATPRNLTILVQDRLDLDITTLTRDVTKALTLLEQETYVQRHGESYEYLTDEEKDVENEIKATDIEPSDLAAELNKLIFESTLSSKKIRYTENGQDYPFSRILDDQLFGREYELAIHVVSPLCIGSQRDALTKMHPLNCRSELLVLLPEDDRFIQDLYLFKKTEKFVRQTKMPSRTPSVQRVIEDKGYKNTDRYHELTKRLSELFDKADFFISGNPIPPKGSGPQQKTSRCFEDLITRSYPYLSMLGSRLYHEKEIAGCLKPPKDDVLNPGQATLTESEQNIFAFIRSNMERGTRSTVKLLLGIFESKPYGWSYASALCILASLCGKAKVEVKRDSSLLEGDDLERALKNSKIHGQLILSPQADFTESDLRGLKNFFGEFFDEPSPTGSPRDIGQATAEKFTEYLGTLNALEKNSTDYPFSPEFSSGIDEIKAISGKPYAWYLTELTTRHEALLDLKERVLKPIQTFLNGSQKEIYRSARRFELQHNPNFHLIESEEPLQLRERLENPFCYRGSNLREMKGLVSSLKAKVDDQLATEKSEAIKTLNALKGKLETLDEYNALPSDKQAEVLAPFGRLADDITKQTLIAIVRDSIHAFEKTAYMKLLTDVTRMAEACQQPEPDEGQVGAEKEQKIQTTPPKAPRVEVISSSSIKIDFQKALLTDEKDLDHYLEALRHGMLEEIKKGKRIQI